jgi:autophagy-related protein 5
MLHLAAPPNDKLFLSSTIDACKQAFMNQLKEADFIRWGNTRRMVGLRKVDQDGLWEGIKERKYTSPHPVQDRPLIFESRQL